jgi:hypothetical protein
MIYLISESDQLYVGRSEFGSVVVGFYATIVVVMTGMVVLFSVAKTLGLRQARTSLAYLPLHWQA